MNLYDENNFNGELWARDINDNIKNASDILSAVYIKYAIQYPDFYTDLKYDVVERFDVFLDTFFIQTQNGYIFEKIKIDTSGSVIPYSLFDNYFEKQKTDIDYWFDEKNRKIYIFGFEDVDYNNVSSLAFQFFFKEYDIKTGLNRYLLKRNVTIPLTDANYLNHSNGILENPKLTYNSDTNIFNVSFLIKDLVKSFGIISMNLSYNDILEINAFIPYANLITENATVLDLSYTLISNL